MANKTTQAGTLLQIEFDSNFAPVVKKKSSKDYLLWGEQNNHPGYLIELYKRDATHGGLIKAKADHVYGDGLCYDTEKLNPVQQSQYESFLSRANPYEDWNSLFRKMVTPFEIFEGIALQVVYNFAGKADIYVQEFAKFRRSPCGKKVFYCERWVHDDGTENTSPEKHESYKEYPMFNPNIRVGTQIIYFKQEVITDREYGNIYPEPNYLQACQDIETSIEITNFHYSNLKNGMFAAAMLSLFNGNPTDEEKKKYSKLFERKFTGTSGSGKILFNFVDPGGQKAELTTLTQADLDKMFDAAGQRAKENIFTGHRTDPVLASVFVDGVNIGENTIYLQKFDRWQKSYIEHRQKILLELIQNIGWLNGYDLSELEVKPKSPAANLLPVDTNTLLQIFDKATLQKHYSKQLGIEVEQPLAPAQPTQQESQINENLKKLSGRDWQHIKRMVREVQNGKTTKEAAAMMLKNGYALTDADIEVLFKTPDAQFSAFASDYVLGLFEGSAVDDNDDPIVSESFVNSDSVDPEIQNKVLDILMGNPTVKAEDVAKLLGVGASVIALAISALVAAGYIEDVGGSIVVTEKAIQSRVPNVETEVYTVFKYVTRDDVPEAETSRPFCKKLLALSRSGKRWTREALDNLSNQLGEDAWTYRGGFYTNPKTGETTPYCRHVWKAIVKSRTKK